jgi:hypothetical protein
MSSPTTGSAAASRPDAERAGDDGQRGEAVRARVQAVRDERCRADRAADRMR